MNLIELVVIGAMVYGAYRLGHGDGVLEEQTAENFRRLDKIIKSLREAAERKE